MSTAIISPPSATGIPNLPHSSHIHDDAYLPAPLLSNSSTDSSSSSDSDHSMGQLVTPRGSVSEAATGTDPVHIRLPSDSSTITFRHGDPSLAVPVAEKNKSSRTLRSKTSFSSWKSSFSSSSVSLRLRPSQDSEDGTVDTRASGQFGDTFLPPQSRSNASPKGRSRPDSSSSPMTPTQSGSSDGPSSSMRSQGSTRAFISSLKRLGVSIRPVSLGRRSSDDPTTPSYARPPQPAPDEVIGPLRVSYPAASAVVVEESALLPPGCSMGLRSDDQSAGGAETDMHAEQEGGLGRGVFSPGPPESPIVKGIEGALSPISNFTLPSAASSPFGLNPLAYPTPVLPSTACPSPSPTANNSRSHIPNLRLACDNLPLATSDTHTSSLPASPRTIRSSLPKSDSAYSVHSLSSLSTASGRRSSGFRTGNTTPTNNPFSPELPINRYGSLPTTQSAQSLSLSSSANSGVRRASSLRSADLGSRGSANPNRSPSTSISPAYTVTRRNSPIPPSLILTPKALVPPVHAISPVIGACPVETNPIPHAEGRPRARSLRWRSPTGLFELGGLGLGSLMGPEDVIRAAKSEEERRGKENYEHVDTPGEFGLGVEKEKEVESKGENPYFS